MNKVIVLPLAETDMKEAYQWYESNQVGLGDRFLKAVKASVDKIRLNPRQFPKRHKNVRAARVINFPFIIHFLEGEEALIVLSVYHTKRNPKQVFKRSGK